MSDLQVPLQPIFPTPVYSFGPHRHSRDWRPNIGQTDTQLAQESIGIATTGVVAGAAIAGATAIGSIAGPIGAIAGALIGLMSQIFSGCGQSCVLTSDAANQVEQLLQQNLEAYLASSRTQSEQAAALANFDNTWAKLVQYCGSPSFGTAGQNCIQDRQRGACKWTASGPSWNGCNYNGFGPAGSGTACFNWFAGYRDPIANDPCVSPDTTVTQQIGSTVSQAWTSISGGSTGSLSSLLPLLLLVGGAFVLMQVAS